MQEINNNVLFHGPIFLGLKISNQMKVFGRYLFIIFLLSRSNLKTYNSKID